MYIVTIMLINLCSISAVSFIKLALLLQVTCFDQPSGTTGNDCSQKTLTIAMEDQICVTFVKGEIFNFSQANDICEKCFRNGSLLTNTTLELYDIVSNPNHALHADQYYISPIGTICNIAAVDNQNKRWTTIPIPCSTFASVICKQNCDASNYTQINDSKITAATSAWISVAILCVGALLALLTFIICKKQRCRKKVGAENRAELQAVEVHAINVEDADANAIAGPKPLLQTNKQYEKELEYVERQINDRKLCASRLVGTLDDAVCQICQKTKFADGVGNKCYFCQMRSCVRCAGPIKTKVVWACALCQKRQQIIVKSGEWLNKDICGPTTHTNQSRSTISMHTSSGQPFSVYSSTLGSGSLATKPQPPSTFQQGGGASNQNQAPAPPSKAVNVPIGDHQSPRRKLHVTQRMSK